MLRGLQGNAPTELTPHHAPCWFSFLLQHCMQVQRPSSRQHLSPTPIESNKLAPVETTAQFQGVKIQVVLLSVSPILMPVSTFRPTGHCSRRGEGGRSIDKQARGKFNRQHSQANSAKASGARTLALRARVLKINVK